MSSSPISNPPHGEQANGKTGSHGHLTLYIVVAIVAAIGLAIVFPRGAVLLDVGGEVFLRLLQMVVVPLVMASVMSGILGMGDVRKLGRPGGFALLYYLGTTVLAVATGLLVVNVINPGVGINPLLVRDAQREGAAAVAHAKRDMLDAAQTLTWGEGHADRQFQTGTSQVVTLPSGHDLDLSVEITQVGRAEQPARATIEVSEDRVQFKPLGDSMTADVLPDEYRWTVKLPRDARQVRLAFEAADGNGVSTVQAELVRGPPSMGDIFKNLVLMLFTKNLLQSMVEMNLLPIILFSIVFAGMLTTLGPRAEVINSLVVAINEALMSFILLLMKLAPVGIFCLVASRFGKAQLEGQFLELMRVLAYYMITVLAGLTLHAVVTLPLLLWLFTRRNPLRFVSLRAQYP
jgi:Na+/H+-dicarboxylate symporter